MKLRNVVGVLRGTDPQLKDTYVMVTGHYDHLGVRPNAQGDAIFNGANDDASGTASVIAVASALAALEEKPKRTIVFMTVFGEEVGGLGARWYTGHPIFPIAKTVADINLEQLGRTDDTEGPKVAQFNLTGFDYTRYRGHVREGGGSYRRAGGQAREEQRCVLQPQRQRDLRRCGDPVDDALGELRLSRLSWGGRRMAEAGLREYGEGGRDGRAGVLDMANNPQAPQWNKENPKTARYVQVREKQ